MITDENKKLAQWAMDYALKNGCQAAKVAFILFFERFFRTARRARWTDCNRHRKAD